MNKPRQGAVRPSALGCLALPLGGVDQLAELQGQGAAWAIAGQLAELLPSHLQLNGKNAYKCFVVADARLLAGPGLNRDQLWRRAGPPVGDLLQGAQAMGQ